MILYIFCCNFYEYLCDISPAPPAADCCSHSRPWARIDDIEGRAAPLPRAAEEEPKGAERTKEGVQGRTGAGRGTRAEEGAERRRMGARRLLQ